MEARTSLHSFSYSQDGDVELRLTRKSENVIVVQSAVLKLHSPYFKASLSERWYGWEKDPNSDGPIKWRYQLLFDDDEDPKHKNTDGDDVMTGSDKDNSKEIVAVPMLQRVISAATTATAPAHISSTTASIMLSKSPWIPNDDRLTNSRMGIVDAHCQLIGLMHHKAFDLPSDDLDETVETIYDINRVTDAYGSLSILTIPVEYAFRCLEADIITSCFKHYAKLIYIATKTRSFWLLREIVCRLVGDPWWPESRISQELEHSDSLELVLKKRQELEIMMRTMDMEIFLLVPPKKLRGEDANSLTLGTAAFRDTITRHFLLYKPRSWESYAQKYRTLQILLLEDQKFRYSGSRISKRLIKRENDFARPANEVSLSGAVCSLARRAEIIIEPLFKSVVKESETIDKKYKTRQGFYCVDLDEDEVPWKDRSW